MSDTVLEVKIAANIAAVGPAITAVQAQIKSVVVSVQMMSASMKASGESAVSAFRQTAAAAKEGVSQRVQDIQSELRVRQDALRQQTNDVRQAEQEGLISHQEAHTRILALVQQEQDATISAANQIAAEHVRADTSLMQKAEAGSAKYIQLKKDETAAALQAQRAITAAVVAGNRARSAETSRETQQFRQAWSQSVGKVVSDFGQGILQMAEGTKTFGQVMRRIGEQILSQWVSNISKMVSQWMMGEVAKTTASQSQSAIRQGVLFVESIFGITTAKTSAAADIQTSTAQTYAGAFAATAAIPIIGPEIAPGVASAAAAAADAGGMGLLTAAGGFDIPGNVNPIVQTHANEMILPASIAQPLRGMISAANFNGAPAANSASGGDTHMHFHMGPGSDGPGLQRWLNENGDKLTNAVNTHLRRGGRLASA